MNTDNDIWIREVGTRDGLQSIQTQFSTANKLEWIRLEAAAGIPEIEVGSFVPPKLLPQMADTAEVVDGAVMVNDLTVSVLVPNLRGAQAGMASGAHLINFPLSVSEAHSEANLRKPVSAAIEDFANVMNYRQEHPEHARVRIGVGLATAFGCTISGQVALADVLRAAEKVIALDPDEIADDEPLFGDGLDADSMVALELVAAIEEAFAIEVTDEELRVELFQSLRSLVEYVEEKVGEAVFKIGDITPTK